MLQTPRNAGLKTTNSFLKKKLANLNERISPRGKKKKGGGGGNKGKAVVKRKGTVPAQREFLLSDVGAQDLIILPRQNTLLPISILPPLCLSKGSAKCCNLGENVG